MAKTDKPQDDKTALKKHTVNEAFYLGLMLCEKGAEIELSSSQATRLAGIVSEQTTSSTLPV